MSSMILQSAQAGSRNNLLALLSTQTAQSNGTADPFARTLNERLENPRERTPERTLKRQTEPARESRPTRQDDAPRSSERKAAASDAPPSTEETAAAQNTPAAGTDTTVSTAASTPPQNGGALAENAQTSDPANTAEELAALPAALAALPGHTATDTEEDASAEPALGDALADKGKRGKAAAGETFKGQKESSLRADKASAGAEPATAANGSNAARISSLVARLQPQTEAAINASVSEPGAKAAHSENQTGSLHGILSPRAPNPLQPGPQLQIAVPPGQRGWTEEIGNKLIWLTSRGESRAELVITPPNLGKVEVSINMNGDQATAHFIAASREVKEALEEALPRLRELMQQSGVNLGQTSVSTSDGQPAHAGADDSSGRGARDGGKRADAGVVSGASAQAGWTRQGEGLIDLFA